MDSEREQFEYAIAQDRYDRDLRLVYSDWLEERALDPELVRFQREWTAEWQQSDDWLRAFAERGRTTIEAVEKAVRNYLETGEPTMLGEADGFSVTNLLCEENELDDFWQHWEVWSKTVVPEDKRREEPFSCCY